VRHLDEEWGISMPRMLLERYGVVLLHQVLIELEDRRAAGKLPALRNPAGYLVWALARAAGEGAARSKSTDARSQRRSY